MREGLACHLSAWVEEEVGPLLLAWVLDGLACHLSAWVGEEVGPLLLAWVREGLTCHLLAWVGEEKAGPPLSAWSRVRKGLSRFYLEW